MRPHRLVRLGLAFALASSLSAIEAGLWAAEPVIVLVVDEDGELARRVAKGIDSLGFQVEQVVPGALPVATDAVAVAHLHASPRRLVIERPRAPGSPPQVISLDAEDADTGVVSVKLAEQLRAAMRDPASGRPASPHPEAVATAPAAARPAPRLAAAGVSWGADGADESDRQPRGRRPPLRRPWGFGFAPAVFSQDPSGPSMGSLVSVYAPLGDNWRFELSSVGSYVAATGFPALSVSPALSWTVARSELGNETGDPRQAVSMMVGVGVTGGWLREEIHRPDGSSDVDDGFGTSVHGQLALRIESIWSRRLHALCRLTGGAAFPAVDMPGHADLQGVRPFAGVGLLFEVDVGGDEAAGASKAVAQQSRR